MSEYGTSPIYMFSSVGNLNVQLLEVIDIADGPKKKSNSLLAWRRKQTEDEKKYIHVEISIRDYNGKMIALNQTMTKPLVNVNETLHLGEEFIFESLHSASVLAISLCFMNWNTSDIVSKINGVATIPISRLEENRKVMQWYQLVDPVTNEGLRTAIRIMSIFNVDKNFQSKVGNIKHSRPIKPEETPVVHSSSIDVEKRTELQPIEKFTDKSISYDVDRVLSRASSQFEDHDAVDCHDDAYAVSKSSSLRRCLIPSPDTSDERKPIEEDMLIGIADYCILLGPSNPYSMRPTHFYLKDGEFQRIPSTSQDWNGYFQCIGMTGEASSCSPPFGEVTSPTELDTSPLSPATDPHSTSFLGPMDSDSQIWDRLPVADHSDLEFPSKIEWFACPEGPITVLHKNRPTSFVRTFALCAGDAEEIYGATLTFFVRTSDEILYEGFQRDENPSVFEPVQVPWWQKDNEGNLIDEYSSPHGSHTIKKPSIVEPRYIWSAVTVCILFRTPYLQEISKCLSLSYNLVIAPQVDAWEISREHFLKGYGISKDQQLLPSRYYQTTRNDLLTKYPPLHISLENLFCFLCMECPVPVPKLLDVIIAIQPPAETNYSIPDRDLMIRFHPQDPSDFPTIAYSMESLLQLFGPRTMIDILCCILSESRILFHSSQIGKLTPITECFRALMYPLTWTHVYLPVVPVQLLNLIEAPVPFILGTHSENLKHINQYYFSEVVVIDCDRGKLDRHSVVNMHLPEKEDRWLIMALSHLHKSSDISYENDTKPSRIHLYVPPNGNIEDKVCQSDLNFNDVLIQVLIFDVLVQLLRHVPDCLFYLNPTCPVFNRPLFMSEYCQEEYRSTLELLTVTNAFHTLTETFQSQSMKFFFDSLERHKTYERNLAVQSMQASRSSTMASNMSRGGPSGNELDGLVDSFNTGFPREIFSSNNQNLGFASPSHSLQRTFSYRARNLNQSVPNNANNLNILHRPSSSTNLLVSVDSPPVTASSAKSLQHRRQSFNNGSGAGVNESIDLKNPTLSLGPSKLTKRHASATEAIFGNFLPKWIISVYLDVEHHVGDVAYSLIDIIHHRLNQHLPFIFEGNLGRVNENKNLIVLKFGIPITRLPNDMNEIAEDETVQDSEPVDSSCDQLNKGEREREIDHDTSSYLPDQYHGSRIFAFFSKKRVLFCQSLVEHWNVKKVAEFLQQDFNDLLHRFKLSPHSVIFDEHEFVDEKDHGSRGNLETPVSTPDSKQTKYSKSPGQRHIQRNLVSHALINHHQYVQNSTFSNKIDHVQKQHGIRVDEPIERFLQKIITVNDLEDSFIENSLLQCQPALRDSVNRKGIVNILKQAKKQEIHGGGTSAGSSVYPLNTTAFDAFSKLFNLILGICFEEKDFITAFELLEVGGHYFRVVANPLANHGNEVSPEEEEEGDSIEFLSEKVCHHPIYQTPELWKTIMHHRLPVGSLMTTSNSSKSSTHYSNKTPSKVLKLATTAVMTEIRSILYMMLGMGVNSARALLFIQAVSTDYSLNIDDYFKLQRFAQSLWAQHESNQLQMHASSQLVAASVGVTDGANTIGQGAKKKSTIRANDLKKTTSMNISDWMEKQGHPEKILTRGHQCLMSMSNMDDSAHVSSQKALIPSSLLASSSTEAGSGTSTINESVSRIPSAASISVDGHEFGVKPTTSRHSSLANLPIPEHQQETDGNEEREHSLSPFSEGPLENERDNRLRQRNPGNLSVKELLLDLEIPEISDSSERGSSTLTGGGHGMEVYSPQALRGAGVESPRQIQPVLGSSSALKLPGLSPKMDGSKHQRGFFQANNVGNHNNRSFATTVSSQNNATTNNRSSLSMDDYDMSTHAYGYANYGQDNAVDNSSIPISAYQPKTIRGFDDGSTTSSESHLCTALDTVSSWLMLGTAEGSIQVVDLRTCSVFGKLKHGSKHGDYYEGVTAVHSIPVPCGEDNDYVFFSGCSTGLVKCWTLPNYNQSALEMAKALSDASKASVDTPNAVSSGLTIGGTRLSVDMKKASSKFVTTPPQWTSASTGNKLRFKQSSLTVKSHTNPITCLTSNVFHNGGSSLSWILASGDRRGSITVVKYDDVNSKATKLHGRGAVSNTKELKSLLNYSMENHSCHGNKNTAVTVMTFVSALGSGHGGGTLSPSMVDPWLAVGNGAGIISVLDITHGCPVFHCEGHSGPVSKVVALNPNEFLSAGYDRSIKLWDIRMKQRVATMLASSTAVWASSSINTNQNNGGNNFQERLVGRPNWRRCAASPLTDVVAGGWDNSLIISSSADGFIKMWDLRYDLHTPCNSIHGHSRRISSISWSGHKEFYTSSYDGTVKSWDSIHGKSTSILHAFTSGAEGFHANSSLHGNIGNRVLQEGIATMKMTDFTGLDEVNSHVSRESIANISSAEQQKQKEGDFPSSKVVKNTNVIVTGGIMGNVKVFAKESTT